MKWNPKHELIPLIVMVLYIILAAYFWSILPDTVPTHFNASGAPDDYSSKTFLVLLNLGVIVLLYLLLTFLPQIDPFWKKIEKRYNVFLMFRDVVLAFFLFTGIVTFVSAAEGRFQIETYGVGFGLLFILLGNYLPRIPRNFFFGVRSPWTLASDEVWKKTHVLAGWAFVGAGVIIIVLSLVKVNFLIVILATVIPITVLVGIAYPFYLYKRLQREGKLATPEL